MKCPVNPRMFAFQVLNQAISSGITYNNISQIVGSWQFFSVALMSFFEILQ